MIDVDWLLDYATRDGVPPALVHHLLASHTPDRRVVLPDGSAIDGVGTVARQAGVRRVVLYHLTPAIDFPPGGAGAIELPPERWRDEVAADFGGPVEVGEELGVYTLDAD